MRTHKIISEIDLETAEGWFEVASNDMLPEPGYYIVRDYQGLVRATPDGTPKIWVKFPGISRLICLYDGRLQHFDPRSRYLAVSSISVFHLDTMEDTEEILEEIHAVVEAAKAQD